MNLKMPFTITPIGVALIGGVLIAVGTAVSVFATYLSQSRQTQDTTEIRQQLGDALDLMRGMAAKTGDQNQLKELIDLRTRALAADGSVDSDAVKDILARIPGLTEEYRKLQATKTTAAEKLLDEYRANWEPLIRFAVGEFDRRITEVTASGIKLNVTAKDDGYKVAGIEQEGGNAQLVRVAQLNGVELRLYCGSAQVHPMYLSGGNLTVTVKAPDDPNNYSNPLNVSFDLKSARSGDVSFGPDKPAGEPSETLRKAIVSGINKGIQDLLVVGNAAAKPK